jgi:hypothetical protein
MRNDKSVVIACSFEASRFVLAYSQHTDKKERYVRNRIK